MRASLLVLALLLAGSFPVAGEQGDHEYRAGLWLEDTNDEWRQASELGWFGEVDLLSVHIQEKDQETMEVVFQTAPADDGPRLDLRLLALHFSYQGRDHRLEVVTEAAGTSAALYRIFGEVPYDASAGNHANASKISGLTVGVQGVETVVSLPRILVRGAQEQPLLAGRVLDGLFATSYGQTRRVTAPNIDVAACSRVVELHYCVAEVRDRVPDDGFALPLELRLQPETEGHLLFYSPWPERASNGEATTFLVQLDIINVGDAADEIALIAEDVPEHWFVDVPPIVAVAPNEHVVVPVAVSIPFQHQHGDQKGFVVLGHSAVDPTLELVQQYGVSWFDVPQLGGHHSVAYLHAGPDGAGWWNADPRRHDEGDAIHVDGYVEPDESATNLGGGYMQTTRRISYVPAFSIGMDAREGYPATAVFFLRSTMTGNGELGIRVVHQPDGTRPGAASTVLFAGGGPVSVVDGQVTEWAGDLDVEAADWFPFQAGNLFLEMRFDLKQTPAEYALYKAAYPAPFVAPDPLEIVAEGSQIRFPLEDFHDVVGSVDPAGGTAIEMAVVGNATLRVNPGTTRVVPLEIGLAEKGAVQLVLGGPGQSWARVVPRDAFVVQGRQEAHVVVEVPDAAIVGEARGIVVSARSVGQDNLQVSRVLRVEVVDEPQPDDAQLAQSLEGASAKKSPSPGTLLTVLLGAWLVGRARR